MNIPLSEMLFMSVLFNQIEIAGIGIVIIIQILVFLYTLRKIKEYKNAIPDSSFFSRKPFYIPRTILQKSSPKTILENLNKYTNKLDAETEALYAEKGLIQEEVFLIQSSENNEIINKILNAINTYLLRNKGASTDFNLVKDIVERNTDVIDGTINLTLPIPLYLGLAGTMLGIVVSLFFMPDINSLMGGVSDAASTLTSDQNAAIANDQTDRLFGGIGVLLDGVKIAMIASFVGLILTLINSGWFFKNAVQVIEERKNSFYTFIQVELLPVLSNNVFSHIDKLERDLIKFNNGFTTNVNDLKIIVENNADAIRMQHQDFMQLKDVDLAKFVDQNQQLFVQFQKSSEAFQKFHNYMEGLGSFIESSNKLNSRVEGVFTYLDNYQAKLDELVQSILNRVEDSQQIIQFLNTHFQSLEDAKIKMDKNLQFTYNGMQDSLGKMSTDVEKRAKSYSDNVKKSEQKLSEVTTDIGTTLNDALNKLKETTTSKLSEFAEVSIRDDNAFKQALEQRSSSLAKLDHLKDIKDSLSEMKKQNGSNELSTLNKQLGSLLTLLNKEQERKDNSLWNKFLKFINGFKN